MRDKKRVVIPVFASVLLLTSCGGQAADEEPNASTQTASGTSDESSTDEAAVAPPTPETCPHHEEVSEAPDDEQFERALDLGCEHGVYGEIVFAEPVRVDGQDSVNTLTDPTLAFSIEEMGEAGYAVD